MSRSRNARRGRLGGEIHHGGDLRVGEDGKVYGIYGAEAWTPRGKRWAKQQARRARRRLDRRLEEFVDEP